MANDELTSQAALHKQIEESISRQNSSLREQIKLTAGLSAASSGSAADIEAAIAGAAGAMDSLATATGDAVAGVDAVGNSASDSAATLAELEASTGTLASGIVGVGKASVKAYDEALKLFERIQSKPFRQGLDDIQKTFGGLSGPDGPFNATNEQARTFVDTTYDVYEGLLASEGAFTDAFGMYPQHVLGDLTTVMGNFKEQITGPAGSINSLKIAKVATSEFVLEQASLTKALGISVEASKTFMTRQISKFGEAGNDMLREAAVYSKNLATMTGDSMKMIAGGIEGIIKDTTRYGNVTVAEAARISVTLRQMGLSYKELGGAVDKFMNFDTAVSSVSALTTVFGVQLDAMEMMRMANEDQETFLRRMREQFLMSAKSVDEMSLAEKRLVMQQVGLSDVGAVERFLDPDAVISSFEALSAGTGEVTEDVGKTMEYLKSDIVDLQQYTQVTSDKMLMMIQEKIRLPFVKTAATVEQDLIPAIREMEKAIPQKTLEGLSALGKGMGDLAGINADKIKEMGESIKSAFQEFVEIGEKGASTDIVESFKTVADDTFEPLGEKIGTGIVDGIVSALKGLAPTFGTVIDEMVKVFDKSDVAPGSASKLGQRAKDGVMNALDTLPESTRKVWEDMSDISNEELQKQLSDSQSYISIATREFGYLGMEYKDLTHQAKLDYKELFKLGEDYDDQLKSIFKSQSYKTGKGMGEQAEYMKNLLADYKLNNRKFESFSDDFKETLLDEYGITEQMLGDALSGSDTAASIAEMGVRERRSELDKEVAAKAVAAKEAADKAKEQEKTSAETLRQTSQVAAYAKKTRDYLEVIAAAVGVNGSLVKAVESGPTTGYSVPEINLMLNGQTLVDYIIENPRGSGKALQLSTQSNPSIGG